MLRFPASLGPVAICAVSVCAFVGAQGVAPQVRDNVARPTTRSIPVGTGSISGTVTAADSGRPVAGARVTLSGSATVTIQPNAATPGARSGAAGGLLVARSVVTDVQGQFAFPRLPAGRFTLSVSQNQYLSVNYGQRRFGGQGAPIPVADGQRVVVDIPLSRGGVITGTVYGETGDPERNARVQALRRMSVGGTKRWQTTGSVTTDDRGMYRLHGLQPGEYIVSATPLNSEAMMMRALSGDVDAVERAIATGVPQPPVAPGFPPTVTVPVSQPAGFAGSTPMPALLPVYAPGASRPQEATLVTIGPSEERGGVDIQVRLMQAGTVQGQITTPVDANVSVQLTLVADDTAMEGNPGTMSTRMDANRGFSFRGVAPGQYILYAGTMPQPRQVTIVNGLPVQPSQQPPTPLTDAQKMWARMPVTVEGGPATTEASVSLRPTRSISGVVLFEMERPPDLSRMRLTVSLTAAGAPMPFAGGQTTAIVGPDGRFTLRGVLPGRLTLRASGLKSALVNGQDTLDLPLDFTGESDLTGAVLTVTDKVTELSGVLTDAAGQALSDYAIVVVSTDSRFWVQGSRRVSMARTNMDGRYVFRSLAPGSYSLAAVPDLDAGDLYDPELLRGLQTASLPVTIVEGGRTTQDLRVK